MAFIPIPLGVRVEMVFTQQGQKVENVFHVLCDTPADVASLNALGAAFKQWWIDEMSALVTAQLVLRAVICTALDSATAPAVEYVAGLPVAGDDPDADMPMNVTVAVRWLTGLHGRSYRGRTYHLGLLQTDVTASEVALTPLGFLILAYKALIPAVVVAGDFLLAVASYYTDNAPRAAGILTEIIDASIDSTLDSQRRRLPGRGT